MSKRSFLLGIVYLLIANGFIASNFVVGQYTGHIIPPWQMAFMRFFIGSLAMLPFIIRPLIKSIPILIRHWHLVALQGFLGVTIAGGFAFESLRSTSAINGAFIFSLSPIITMILATFLLKERLGKIQIIGVIITIVGVLGILSQGHIKNILRFQFTIGDLWMFANAISYACYTVFIRSFKIDVPPAVLLFGMIMIGCFFMLFPCAYEISQHDIIPYRYPHIWGVLLYAGIFTSAIGYFFYIKGTQLAGSSVSGLLIYTMPIFSTIQAYFFLGDALHIYHFISISIMLAGILLVTTG